MTAQPDPAGSHGGGSGPALPAHQGLVVDGDDPQRLRAVIEAAFGYRGDVTILTRHGESIVGYVFDRLDRPELAASKLRILPAGGGPRVTLSYDQVASVAFTGRDTATGKSFEAWVRRYVQKKLAGEAASLESDEPDGREPSPPPTEG
jgi:hypothetical protein